MFNEVILIGKLVNKPIIKETSQGVKLTNMVIQIERPYKNNLGIKDTDYIQCVLWRGIAAQVCETCDIGSMIGVKGRLQSKTHENSENQAISLMEVKVEHVEFLDKYFKEK